MKYDVIPINKKVLLRKARLEQDLATDGERVFVLQEELKVDPDYFEVVAMATDCVRDYTTEIVTVENYQPLGQINGEELFICDEKFVTCRIVPKNVIKDSK